MDHLAMIIPGFYYFMILGRLLEFALLVAAVIALVMTFRLRRTSAELQKRVESLDRRLRMVAEARRPSRREADVLESAAPSPVLPSQEPTPAVVEEPAPPAPIPWAPGPPLDKKPRSEVVADRERWASFEETVGKRWMTWAGALALFLSAAFFMKHAFDNQWIGPMGRVVLGILAGLGLLAGGDTLIRRNMKALGQGLMGGGLAILYVSLFAAFAFYKLIPQAPAFAAMAMVTAGGMTLAILRQAHPLAILAVLGGFISPLLVSTGADPRDALFGYLAVLDFGVLGVAFFRRWRALDTLAFVGTVSMLVGWHGRFYTPEALLPTLLWVGVFFLIFLIVPFAYQLRYECASQVESFVLALANAAFTFSACYELLRRDYLFALGFVALFMAASYLCLGTLVRRRVPEDSRSLFGFVGLSVVMLTMAVPLHLKLHGVTLAWAIEGPVLLYLGYVYGYRPVRIAGFVVVILAALRLFSAHWPLHHAIFTPFFNPHFGAALFLTLSAGAYSVIHDRFRRAATSLDLNLMTAAGILAGFLAIVITSGEMDQWVLFNEPFQSLYRRYYSWTIPGIVWGIGAWAFLAAAVRTASRPVYYSGLLVCAVALAHVLHSYEPFRNHGYIFVNLRFFAALLATAALFGYALVEAAQKDGPSRVPSRLLYTLFVAVGLALLWVISLEVYTYCMDTISRRRTARWTAQMWLSIVWGLYGVAALVIGFWRRIRAVRIAALGLLAVTAAKVIFVDTSSLGQMYRIVSFVGLGVILFAASYLYHRLEQRLGDQS